MDWVIYHSVGSSRRALCSQCSPITRTHAHAHAHAQHKSSVHSPPGRCVFSSSSCSSGFPRITPHFCVVKKVSKAVRKERERVPPLFLRLQPYGAFHLSNDDDCRTGQDLVHQWLDYFLWERESGVKRMGTSTYSTQHTPFCLPRAQQTLPTYLTYRVHSRYVALRKKSYHAHPPSLAACRLHLV